MNDFLVVLITLGIILVIMWLCKSRPKKKKNELVEDIKKTFKSQWQIAVDQSRANLHFKQHDKSELMNKGYDLAAAKELTKNE